jgi:hypothetical protein
MKLDVADLAPKIKPYVLGWLSDAGVSLTGNYAPSPHDMSGVHHAGAIADDQGPQFVRKATIDTISVSHVWNALQTFSLGVTIPAGQILTVSGSVGSSLIPTNTDQYDLGSSDKLWRKGYLSEIDALVFAKETITLLGGWLIVGHNEGAVTVDVQVGDSSVFFGQSMSSGDWVLFRSVGKVEYMLVGASYGSYEYAVTRNLDGSGANFWPAGSVYLVLGTTGDGRIELNSYDTPRISILKQGAAYNLTTYVARIGDLDGTYGIATELYGIGLGDYAAGNYMRYDPTNGFLISAGAGSLRIQAGGITLTEGTAIDPVVSYRFTNGAAVDYAGLYGYQNPSPSYNGVELIAYPIASKASIVGLQAVAPSTYHAATYITVASDVTQAQFLVSADSNSDVNTGTFVTLGAFIVGGEYTKPVGLSNGDVYVAGRTNLRGWVFVNDGGHIAATTADARAGVVLGATDDTKAWGLINESSTTKALVKMGVYGWNLNEWVMAFHPGGNINMGSGCTTLNTKATRGLTLSQAGADDEILAFKSSDIAHGVTDLTETSTYGDFKKVQPDYGGVVLTGFTETYIGAQLHGIYTTDDSAKTASADGGVLIVASKKSGTGIAAMGANANLLVVRNYTTNRFILDADGDSHQDVGTAWTNFDNEDDIVLLDAACTLLERDPLRKEFLETLETNRDLLSRLRVVTFNEDGHHFVNWSRMSMLIIGAIRQLARRMYETSGAT